MKVLILAGGFVMHLNNEIKIYNIFEKERVGDVKHSLVGIDKAKRMLGYKAIYRFEEGLEHLINLQE